MTKSGFTFGHKVFKSVFSNEEIAEINEKALQLAVAKDQKNSAWKYFDHHTALLSRIEYFINFSAFFKDLSDNRKLLDLLSTLVPCSAVLFKDKINFKYSGGEGFIPHQDITAGWGDYSSFHATIAIPLTDTTLENGGLYFSETLNTQLTPNHVDISEKEANKLKYTFAGTSKGDVIIFDSYVAHKSYINNSKYSRPILFFTYTFDNENYYEKYHQDKFANNPPDIYKIAGHAYRSNQGCGNEVIFKSEN